MDSALFPHAELRRRRARFLDRVARARLASYAQRDALLREAITVAQLHHELTGTPLLADVEGYLHAGNARIATGSLAMPSGLDA